MLKNSVEILVRLSDGDASTADRRLRVCQYLCTNSWYVDLMTEIGIENTDGISYRFLNEFNPALPILRNKIDNTYRVKAGFGQHPVVGVSHRGAMLAARAVGGRLPLVGEWEFFATGAFHGRMFPWGNFEPAPFLANFAECYGGTTAVGKFPPTESGLFDLAGNVEEWCELDGCSLGDLAGCGMTELGMKPVKGGAWNKGGSLLVCTKTRMKYERIRTVGTGFRVVWDEACAGIVDDE